MKGIKRRMAGLERRADLERTVATAPPAVEPGDLAAGLVDAWRQLDAGTFDGDVYHERALVTLRATLETLDGR